MSGPELIMPSIYEVPISEASWVAPGMRSENEISSHTMRKRRKSSSQGGSKREKPQSRNTLGNSDAGSSTPDHQSKRRSLIAKFTTFCRNQSTFFRTAINGLLIALILHLLVLPEVIYQMQHLCQFPTVKSLYPDSCVRLTPRSSARNHFHSTHPIYTREESITTSQKDLETIFDSTLQVLTPLSHLLKESESMLRDLHEQLETTFPDARNALDLEFQGSDQAIFAATWEFDSLRADLRSAVESLLASPPPQEATGSSPSIARDTRLAAQLRRRAEYLERLRAQIRSKADSLGARFSTLDDHLEALDGIVTREERRGSLVAAASGGSLAVGARKGKAGTGLHAVLSSLSSYASFGPRVWSRSPDDSSAPHEVGTDSGSHSNEHPRPITTLALLRLAATHHRPVADSVHRLSRQLGDVQRAGLGPT